MKSQNFVVILVGLLLITSFLLGISFNKIQNLEKGNIEKNSPIPTSTKPGKLNVSQKIGMDKNKFKSCLESNKYEKQAADDLEAGKTAGVNGTPATFINGRLVSGAQPFENFKKIIDEEIANPNQSAQKVSVDPGPFPALGNQKAPVAVIEFADFQCPFCERFYKDTKKKIEEEYVKTGKVKFYFRNYAFLGPDSVTAAEGSYCANEQGKFWQYHNFLFENQGAENSGTFSKENLE